MKIILTTSGNRLNDSVSPAKTPAARMNISDRSLSVHYTKGIFIPQRHVFFPRMRIQIIAVGKVKERYLQEGIEEYLKRLQPYTTLQMVEVPDEKVSPHAREREKDEVRHKEGIRLLSAVPDGAWIVTLHPEGVEVSSRAFAERMSVWEINGPHLIAFLIGGELGLSSQVLAAADLQMSLSRMTFPHQMVRLILLEALYRAFRQIRGEPYQR